MLPFHTKDASSASYSKLGGVRILDKISSQIRLILSDPNSSNLLFFLLLNFSFAFVELFYGIWTNSLGLISDSFHMFFDCTGLLAGLAASVSIEFAVKLMELLVDSFILAMLVLVTDLVCVFLGDNQMES